MSRFLRAASVSGAISLAVVLAFLLSYRGNITGFFAIGDALPRSPYLPSDALVRKGTDGFDGQYFLALAYDPFLRHPATIAALDSPRYRARRILYPLAAYALSLGDRTLIPWALVLINIACIASIGGLMALESRNGAMLAALTPLAFQGAWVSLALSTSDLMAFALLSSGLSLLRRQSPARAALALSLASFTREPCLAQGICLALFAAGKRDRKAASWVLTLQAPPLLWNILAAYPDPVSAMEVSYNLGAPFLGMVGALRDSLSAWPSGRAIYQSLSLFLLIATAALHLFQLIRPRAGRTDAHIAALPLILLLIVFGKPILEYFAGYARNLFGLYALLWLSEGGPIYRRTRMAITLASAAASLAWVARRLSLAWG